MKQQQLKRWRVKGRGGRGAVLVASDEQIAPWRHLVEPDDWPTRSVVVDRAMHAPPVATVIE